MKLTLFGIAAVVCSFLLKTVKSEWGMLLSFAAGILILLYLFGFLNQMLGLLTKWNTYLSGMSDYMGILWKALGITYLCEFTGSLSKDTGNTLIAGQIELCGKVAVLVLGMPILMALLETIAGYMK